MFKDVVMSTAMSSKAANDYFSNKIYGDAYNGDVTAVSTLRALFHDKLKDGDYINFVVDYNHVTKKLIEGSSLKSIANKIMPKYACLRDGSNMFYFCPFTYYKEDNEAAINLVEKDFQSMFGGYEKIEKVTNLFSKTCKVICYVNAERKNVAMFASDVTMKKYHVLQCAFLGIFPWLIDTKNGISEINRKLSFSLNDDETDTPEEYLSLLKEIANTIDFETERMNRLLTGIESKFYARMLEKNKYDLINLRNDLANKNEAIANLISKINELNIKIIGCELGYDGSKDKTEILDYFKLHSKIIDLEDVSESVIYFAVKGYLCYFDEACAKRMIDNDNSYLYGYIDSEISRDDARALFTAIFVDQSIRIKTCAAFALDITRGVHANSDHTFSDKFVGYFPNPHINNYGCMGNYVSKINEQISNGNNIGALDLCLSSTNSLNFNDGTVISRFSREIFNNRNKCYFELPDYSNVNVYDAIAWAKTKENN